MGAIALRKAGAKRTLNNIMSYEFLIKVLTYTGARIDEVLPAGDFAYKSKVKTRKA